MYFECYRVTLDLQLTDLRCCTRSLTTCLRADAADMQQLMVGLQEAALQSEHGNFMDLQTHERYL